MTAPNNGTTDGGLNTPDAPGSAISRLEESRKQIRIVRESLDGSRPELVEHLNEAENRLELVETTLRYDVGFSTAREIHESRPHFHTIVIPGLDPDGGP